MKYLIPSLLLLLAFGCNQPNNPAPGDHATSSSPTGSVPADRTNTAVNSRDSSSVTKTPMDQSENQDDLNKTADIRKQIREGHMSVNANNVKIVTESGRVTLRGPVNSEDEKQRIGEIAKNVVGVTNVNNQLEVAK